MAKFAIALCILLVACTSTQGSVGSDLLAAYEAKVNEIKEAVAAKIIEFSELLENAVATAESYLTNLIAKAEVISAEAEAKKQELLEKYGNLNSCVSSNFDVTDIVEEFKQSAITCVSNRLDTVKSNYETLHASFDSLTEEASTLVSNTEACVAEGTNVLLCILRSDYAELKNNFNTVVTSGVTLASDLSGISDSLKACATESALESVSSAVQDYLSTVEACLASA